MNLVIEKLLSPFYLWSISNQMIPRAFTQPWCLCLNKQRCITSRLNFWRTAMVEGKHPWARDCKQWIEIRGASAWWLTHMSFLGSIGYHGWIRSARDIGKHISCQQSGTWTFAGRCCLSCRLCWEGIQFPSAGRQVRHLIRMNCLMNDCIDWRISKRPLI